MSTGPPIKKRRTFFSSSNLASLPTFPPSSSSKSVSVSRDRILAPLLDADQQAAQAAKAKSTRPRRDVKPRVSDQSADNEDWEDVNESSDGAKGTPGTGTESEVRAGGRQARPIRTTRREISTSLLPTLKRTTNASSKATATGRGGKSKRSTVPPPTRSIRIKLRTVTTPAPAPAPPVNPVTPKDRFSSKNTAATAQNSNERLALAMQMSMRATLQGRSKPYMRVPVWSEVMKAEQEKKGAGSKKVATAKSTGRGGRVKINTRVTKVTTGRGKRKQAASDDEEEEDSLTEIVDEEEIVESVPLKPAPRRSKKHPDKEYMTAGFYCQDANAKSPHKLINKVLGESSKGVKGKKTGRPKGRQAKMAKSSEKPSFPPLPYDYGEQHFFGEQHDFRLPYDIHQAASSGSLNDKKKPAPYQKVRGNVYPERSRYTADYKAICKCDPDSGCGENCINRIMSYLCGKDCPCGENCTNKSLAKRPMPQTKVFYTGSRGFGLMAMEDIKAGSFVTDYRGEIITINSFIGRIENDYVGHKNYYALAYDQDEVIDAGMRGNDARFINHGCDPNLEVRKYQVLGDGLEEFEVGMWAIKDIAKGQELFYNYNFDSFGAAKEVPRVLCHCGAPNCIGFLGRRPGDKTAKEIRQELEEEAARQAASSRKGKGRVAVIAKKLGRRPSGPAGKNVGRQRSRAKVQKVVQARAKAVKVAKVKAKAPTSVPVEAAVISPVPDLLAEGSSMPTASSSSDPTPLTPDKAGSVPGDDKDSNASAKRKSGWANWLVKLAGEKPRTLEEWHEERMKRRRGIDWMNDMIAEFGIAPSTSTPQPDTYADGRKPAGSVGSFANTLASLGHGPGPSGVKNLGGPRPRASEGAFREDTASASDVSAPVRKRGRPRKSAPAVMDEASQVEDLLRAQSDDAKSPTEIKERVTEKKEAIKKRNGAPMGWMFVPVGQDPASVGAPTGSRLVSAVETNLDRSARRGRASLGRTETLA